MYVIGIDIGASSVKSSLISELDGVYKRVVDKETVALSTNEFGELKSIILDICRRRVNQGARPIVGISTAGAVNKDEIIVNAGNFHNYSDVSWKRIIGSVLDQSMVYTTNDGRASAWGEYIAAPEKPSIHVHAVVGTGIGGGIIYNGDLLSGVDGQAGYLGHIKVTSSSIETCSCGKRGCVGALSSSRGILALYNTLFSCDVQCNDFFTIMNQSNNILPMMKVLSNTGYWLGVAIGNVMNVLNPERVTIGGGVIQATEDFTNRNCLSSNPYFDAVKKGVQYASHYRVKEKCEVALGLLGNNAGMIGAANLAVNKYANFI